MGTLFTNLTNYIGVNQPLTCNLDTETDLATANTYQIRLKNYSSGATTLYIATQVGATQVITGLIPGGVLSAGKWVVQAWVTFDHDSNPVPGKPIYLIAKNG